MKSLKKLFASKRTEDIDTSFKVIENTNIDVTIRALLAIKRKTNNDPLMKEIVNFNFAILNKVLSVQKFFSVKRTTGIDPSEQVIEKKNNDIHTNIKTLKKLISFKRTTDIDHSLQVLQRINIKSSALPNRIVHYSTRTPVDDDNADQQLNDFLDCVDYESEHLFEDPVDKRFEKRNEFSKMEIAMHVVCNFFM